MKMKTKNKKKQQTEKEKKKKSLFFNSLRKMCIFCLYPILDSQQRVKRSSCRRPILFELLVSF